MLILIGLGLHDEKDITLRGIEQAKKSDKVYIELYTSKWYGDLENLKKIIGKDITEVERIDLEENSQKILNEAKKLDVSLFVLGDPLVATTHSSLILEAQKQKIKTKVIHNASIISAIGETGLHLQKFGPYVTIPFPERTKSKLPESVYEVIRMNKERGLHTLCLLDINEGRAMTPKEAIEILLELENHMKRKVIKKDLEIVVFSKVGSDDSKIIFDVVENIKDKNLETPAVIVIPGKLHFTEKDFLLNIKKQ